MKQILTTKCNPGRLLVAAVTVFCLLQAGRAQLSADESAYGENTRSLVDFDAPWDEDLIAAFARLPVQDNGRVKPFDTVARYVLLRFHGRQSISFTTDPDEEPTKRSATEWALYALFAPDSIRDLPLFVIDDSEAAVIAGLEPGSKRDRYSYNEIIPHIDTLRSKALEYANIPEKDRGRLQKMVVEIYRNLNEFEFITRFFEFARDGIPMMDTPDEGKPIPPGLVANSEGKITVSGFLDSIPDLEKLSPDSEVSVAERFGSVLYQIFSLGGENADIVGFRRDVAALTEASGKEQLEVGKALNTAADNLARYIGRTRAEMKDDEEEAKRAKEVATAAAAEGRWKVVQEALRISNGTAGFLTLFPPPAAAEGDEENDWFNPTDLVHLGIQFDELRPFAAERIRLLEKLNASVEDPNAFKANAESLFSLIETDAGDQHEASRIDREVRFFRSDFFTNALVFFVLAFILVIVSFLAPVAKWSRILSGPVAATLTVVGLLLLVWGVIERCRIMGRPPVGTLYETNLFIAAIAVMVGLAIEYFNRRRIALLLSAFIGAGLLFVANRFHIFESKDTMDPLVAVLRTNFWLSVHVTTVCMGYSAGLVAAIIGYIYLIARLAGEPEQGDVSKELTRMAYGVVCFGMLFSLFGTVTGGIWANYSWGRFWGWDPKENGAFMIVLWNMVILHSRLGGYARQLGIHVLTIIGGAIVAFSWWGVNQLEVGLHSYGFTDGIWSWLLVFWYFSLGMVVLALAVHLFKDKLVPPSPTSPSASKKSAA